MSELCSSLVLIKKVSFSPFMLCSSVVTLWLQQRGRQPKDQVGTQDIQVSEALLLAAQRRLATYLATFHLANQDNDQPYTHSERETLGNGEMASMLLVGDRGSKTLSKVDIRGRSTKDLIPSHAL
ncbi:predicted protein [Histoplasma capsulatum var. duboisii H88]|uniref:Predicted protein n=1 Tax=Ajellomyces capsulatus (strain H88) TaxID=544711 RepID=F0UPP1_AJEC8|nr:predicted protein [Histoplasma capsulatum var. duboisii H88]